MKALKNITLESCVIHAVFLYGVYHLGVAGGRWLCGVLS